MSTRIPHSSIGSVKDSEGGVRLLFEYCHRAILPGLLLFIYSFGCTIVQECCDISRITPSAFMVCYLFSCLRFHSYLIQYEVSRFQNCLHTNMD